MAKKVAVIFGGSSGTLANDPDLVIVKKAVSMLREFGIEAEMHCMSAHRTPKEACAFAENARANGFGVIIAAAGKAAHLAGVLAAHTTLPVIGIPIKASALDGLDALLSIVQMPRGVPVATVAIDGAENAAILAAQILGVYDDNIAQRLIAARESMTADVLRKDRELQEAGY